ICVTPSNKRYNRLLFILIGCFTYWSGPFLADLRGGFRLVSFFISRDQRPENFRVAIGGRKRFSTRSVRQWWSAGNQDLPSVGWIDVSLRSKVSVQILAHVDLSRHILAR